MKAVTFLLHALQPILATSFQGDANSDVSHPYIPGSMIRGLLISRYLQKNGIKQTDDILDIQQFPDVKRLFFNPKKNRYLNAYPAINNKRTLPIPRSWYKDKGVRFSKDKNNIYDFSKIHLDEQSELLNDNEKKLSPKLLDEDFCLLDEDNDVFLYRVKRRINIHNQRDRKRGKGIEGSGAIFHYNAIDAGQTFQSAVLCDSEEDRSNIKSLLTLPDAWLGGSQSAGYGHIEIELLNEDEFYEIEIDLKERLERKENLTITLLSDTIIYNEYGQGVTDPKILCQLLSKSLNSKSLNKDIKFREDKIYASSLIVGGFNRKWGLPLPQTPALAAGSVFIFEKIDIDSQSFQEYLHNVQTIEAQGIGERRVDGFGRVVFNWLDKETEIYRAELDTIGERQANRREKLKPESSKIVADIANRIMRKRLDELLIHKLSSTSLNNQDDISNSQLSRLILIVRQVLYEVEFEQNKPENERKTIQELAEPVYSLLRNLPSNARKQFENTKLDENINKWLSNPDNWLKDYWRSSPTTKNLVVDNQPKLSIGGKDRYIDVHIALEYSLRLIMAVAKKTMKEKNND